jgi:multiple antibiotic resistance protein
MNLELFKTEWAYLSGAFVTLLFIIDPFAVVPVYLTLTERFSAPSRAHIRRKAVLIALMMLMVFAVSGMKFFELFGITLPAFQIAGGLLLLILGVSQLNAEKSKVTPTEQDEGLSRDDVSVFPLATPLLAGPGAISTVILLVTKAETKIRFFELLGAIFACMLVAFVVLRFSHLLYRLLGNTGLNLLSRIMGIVLTAVAVQFILNGLHEAGLGLR